jgi:hypothetical protein
MLITGQAANCRRVKAQSRSSTHLAVDHGSQHLALQPAKGRRTSEVQVLVQGACRLSDAQIDRKSLVHACTIPPYCLRTQPKKSLRIPVARSGTTVRMFAICLSILIR